MKRKFLLCVLWLLVGLSFLCAPSTASALSFTGTSGNLAASADFSIVGSNLLQVILTNTSTADVLNQSQVLTAVFFDINGVGALTPVSAVLNTGSTVWFDPDGQPAGGVVGGEWAYGSSLVGAPGGATKGISSSGLGLFGAANFPGPNLDDNAASVNGVGYGITSAGDNPATPTNPKPPTGPVTGKFPLIQDSVVFMLSVSGLPLNFTLNAGSITNVSFQYGTSLADTNIPVPEPATMMLLGSGLIGLAVFGRKRFLKGA